MRFNYIKYSEDAVKKQQAFKDLFEELEKEVNGALPVGRASSLVLTKLVEAYMWVGKAIRDEQVSRGGDATDQPARGE